jgi:hypothetical protein
LYLYSSLHSSWLYRLLQSPSLQAFLVSQSCFAFLHPKPSIRPQHIAIPRCFAFLSDRPIYQRTAFHLLREQLSLRRLDTAGHLTFYSPAVHPVCLVDLIMAGVQPAPPEMWQCHICFGGPYLYANTTRCTNIRSNNLPCGHDFCHQFCKKDREIPAPMTTLQSSIPGLRSTYYQPHPTLPKVPVGGSGRSADNRRVNGLDGGSNYARAGQASRNSPDPGSAYTRRSAPLNDNPGCRSRPSPRGYWMCCACKELNNPALAIGRCWSCQHPGPCTYCAFL